MAYYYRYVLQVPSEAFWYVKDGILNVMCTFFKISAGNIRTVRRVLQEVRKYLREGREYKGFTERKWEKVSLLTSGSK